VKDESALLASFDTVPIICERVIFTFLARIRSAPCMTLPSITAFGVSMDIGPEYLLKAVPGGTPVFVVLGILAGGDDFVFSVSGVLAGGDDFVFTG
jgi:hypothetical protein